MSFFALDDYGRFATFASASASPSGLEAQNLAAERVNTRWRVTGLSPGSTRVAVDVTFAPGTPARAPIHYLFVQRPRYSLKTELAEGPVFGPTDTIRVIFYEDEIGGVVVEDTGDLASGMIEGVGVFGLWRPAGVAFEAMRIEFDAVSRAVAPANFTDMGVVRFGPAHQFAVDYVGFSESPRSNSSLQRPSLGASLYARKGAHWRHWSLLFRCIRDSERAEVRKFLYANYDGSQFVFGHDETNPAESWMLAAMINPDVARASVNFRRLPLELEEAL
ncbi:MAG: hypothetical protein AB7P23_09705 [Amphiplicatus sp.]